MLIIFNFNQSKNNSIYLYDIINLIWYYSLKSKKAALRKAAFFYIQFFGLCKTSSKISSSEPVAGW
jgi:hypothetical protein